MSGTEKAHALLGIALETYAEEIRPALPKDRRYAGAMVANALGIAERRLAQPDPADALLAATGAEDMASLAKAIRSGEITEADHNSLADDLLAYLEAELAITNPKFLERRKEG